MTRVEKNSTARFPELNELFTNALEYLDQNARWPELTETEPNGEGPCAIWQSISGQYDVASVAALMRLFGTLPSDPDELVESIYHPFAVTVIETGNAAWVAPTQEALNRGLLPAIRNQHKYLPKFQAVSPEARSPSKKRSAREDFAQDVIERLAKREPVIFVIDRMEAFPDVAKPSVSNWKSLASLTWPMIKKLHEILHGDQEVRGDVVGRPEPADSSHLSTLKPDGLALAARRPRFSDAVSTIKNATTQTSSKPRGNALKAVKGLGDSRLHLEQLSADMANWATGDLQWSEIPRGVLLYGPPGTGKTFTTSKLAEQTGFHFVATSYADWQKRGHLGDFIKAMAKSFEDARDNAPSLLFIDEIDSFGDRETASGDNAGYVRAAANALLEQLDGARTTQGVLVVGACNSFDKLDSALIRSGRFDLKIEMKLPDKAAFSEILKSLAGDAVSNEAIRQVSAHLVGYSGADAAAVVRQARSLSRRHNRGLTDQDILMTAKLFAPASSPDDLQRAAIHEAGHVIVGHALGRGVPVRAEITAQGGSVEFASKSHYPTAPELEAMISTALAGRVAESAFLNSVSSGAGGNETSDLARATLLAVQMETQFGFGAQRLLWRPIEIGELNSLLADPAVLKKVNIRLERAEQVAKVAILQRRQEVTAVAAALLEHRQLGLKELEAILAPAARRQGPESSSQTSPDRDMTPPLPDARAS
ncbi:AAA family ATPase [Ruegeria arenilitoris]|uniref:AAA family ATPase n=1 Tax=Ruegeria arenilitoris TaxID=1173585 RepID=UPI00147C9B7A|nr:AAA family ATPase [Ruegeria arenilitoris]